MGKKGLHDAIKDETKYICEYIDKNIAAGHKRASEHFDPFKPFMVHCGSNGKYYEVSLQFYLRNSDNLAIAPIYCPYCYNMIAVPKYYF